MSPSHIIADRVLKTLLSHPSVEIGMISDSSIVAYYVPSHLIRRIGRYMGIARITYVARGEYQVIILISPPIPKFTESTVTKPYISARKEDARIDQEYFMNRAKGLVGKRHHLGNALPNRSIRGHPTSQFLGGNGDFKPSKVPRPRKHEHYVSTPFERYLEVHGGY